MTIETLLYHSGMTGMPSATLVAAGGMTALLDACLVNGMNLTSVTGITRTGDVATAVLSGANPFQINEVVEIAGATPAAYNGRFRVTARTTSSVSYDVAGTPATPASGTMTARHPPAGWTRQEFATNVVAYRDGGPLGHYMQIEDNNPYNDGNASCRTRMAVGLTGLDSGTQLNAQHRIQKANNWVLAADSRTCYVVMGAQNTFHFGEIGTYVTADAYAWHQSRGETASASFSVRGSTQFVGRHSPCIGWSNSHTTDRAPIACMRDYSQLVQDVWTYVGGVTFGFSASCWNTGMALDAVLLPNAADSSVPLSPLFLYEGAGTYSVRGMLRGAYYPLGTFGSGQFQNNVAMLDDVVINGQTRRLALVRYGFGSVLQMAFDLTGSWG